MKNLQFLLFFFLVFQLGLVDAGITNFFKRCQALGVQLCNQLIGERLAIYGAFFGANYQFKHFGSRPVDPVLEQEFFRVCEKLKLSDEDFVIRAAHDGVTEKPFATHNAVFINSDWFAALSQTEQKFYLAHEAAHLKRKDSLNFVLFSHCLCALSIGLIATSRNQLGYMGLGLLGLLDCMLLNAVSRYQEKQADLLAAQVAEINIDPEVLCRYEEQTQASRMQWLTSWFEDHPDEHAQLRYLLKQQKILGV